MKEAIGGTSLFLIVIVILSVFAIYISLSVNWSTAYKVKDEIIFYIDKNGGVTTKTISDINTYLADVGYFNYGECPKGEGWKGYNITQGTKANTNFQYCIAKVVLVKNNEAGKSKNRKTDNTDHCACNSGVDRAYYAVRTFFLVDMPIIRGLGLTIDGETKVLTEPKDCGLPCYYLGNSSTGKGVWSKA